MHERKRLTALSLELTANKTLNHPNKFIVVIFIMNSKRKSLRFQDFKTLNI